MIALPLPGLMRWVPVAERGSGVPASLLPPLLGLAVAGTSMEEMLFRGFVQRSPDTCGIAPVRTVLLSGLIFACGHIFLATTVTGLGWPVLAFTLGEGLACAWVRQRGGVLPATITHGSIIFAVASGP